MGRQRIDDAAPDRKVPMMNFRPDWELHQQVENAKWQLRMSKTKIIEIALRRYLDALGVPHQVPEGVSPVSAHVTGHREAAARKRKAAKADRAKRRLN